jgi:pimeloyl-ACP methyl ester carboxylesterase
VNQEDQRPISPRVRCERLSVGLDGAPLGIPEPAHFALELARHLRVQPRVHRRARRGIEARFGIPWSQLRIPALAPEMPQPLLVIHDATDREVPHSHGESVAASWPGARLITTRGLGHQRILRDEDVVRRAVEFVTRREERGEIAS